MTGEEYEDKCERCGVACLFTAIHEEKNVAIWGLGCKFFDRQSRLCTVYPERFEKAPWCHHSSKAAPLGMLRTTCPYNETGEGKTARYDPEYETIFQKVLPQILSRVWPAYVGKEAFLAELRAVYPEKEWETAIRDGGVVFQEKGKPSFFYITPSSIKEWSHLIEEGSSNPPNDDSHTQHGD